MVTSPKLEKSIHGNSPKENYAIRTLWPGATSSDEMGSNSSDLDWSSSPSRLRRSTGILQPGSMSFSKGSGSNLGVEPSPGDADLEGPAEPCLKATRLSNLSAMSELDLEESNETKGGRAIKLCEEDNGDKSLASSSSEVQQATANIGGGNEHLSARLPPHLRKKSTYVGRPVNTFNLPAIDQNLWETLPIFTLTAAPLPGIAASRASATGELTTYQSEVGSFAAGSLSTTHTTKPAEPPRSSMRRRLTISHPTPPPLVETATRVNQWNSFAGQPQGAGNRPERTASATAVSGSYGVPIATKAPIVVDPNTEKTLYFSRWPTVDANRPTSKPRTVVITEMPDNSTLAMVSSVCKNTGLIESITLVPAVRRAIVWFIEAADAQKLHDRTGNGVLLHYDQCGKALKKTVFVEMRRDVDILSSAMRTRVDEAGHSRVVRIVGWERRDLEQAAGTNDGTSEALLKIIAGKCAMEGKTERLESVAVHVNASGHWEATLVFAGIKEAYSVLGAVRRMLPFEACNITFGRDP